MSNPCDDDYRLKAEKKIKELEDLPEYNITGQALVNRIQYQSRQIGADTLSEDDLCKEVRLDVKKIFSRYGSRRPRANYGKISTDYDQ